MGSHIYACLGKPLDPEEFRYWMKSIARKRGGPAKRPSHEVHKSNPIFLEK